MSSPIFVYSFLCYTRHYNTATRAPGIVSHNSLSNQERRAQGEEREFLPLIFLFLGNKIISEILRLWLTSISLARTVSHCPSLGQSQPTGITLPMTGFNQLFFIIAGAISI
jgi:hypothetical protein